MKKVSDLDKAPEKNHVRVKIMKYVGEYTPGDVVDCEPEVAEHLCKESKVNNGESLVSHVKAVRYEDVSKLKEQKMSPRDLKNMTQKDMADMGLKNIVKTPRDEQFEKNLEIAKKSAEKEQSKRQKMMAAKKEAEGQTKMGPAEVQS